MRFLLMVLVFAALSGSSAGAFPPCQPHDNLLPQLERKYKEAVVSRGLNGMGSMVEVLASAKGTFTIILTSPKGLSCIIAEGVGWEDVRPPVGEPA